MRRAHDDPGRNSVGDGTGESIAESLTGGDSDHQHPANSTSDIHARRYTNPSDTDASSEPDAGAVAEIDVRRVDRPGQDQRQALLARFNGGRRNGLRSRRRGHGR